MTDTTPASGALMLDAEALFQTLSQQIERIRTPELKLAGMASRFYHERVGQHLEIGIRALGKLRSQPTDQLHSRKLRSFAEVAFQ